MSSGLRKVIPFFITIVLIASGISAAYAQVARMKKTGQLVNAPAQISALVYDQPVDPIISSTLWVSTF